MKALVVDDNILNLKVAQKLIEHEGLEVDIALSGMECIDKVKENHYDIIFMDIMMPEMDGIETFNKLRELDRFDTPVVTLTADAETGAKEKYIEMGFVDYISKPIQKDILHQIIKNILEK